MRKPLTRSYFFALRPHQWLKNGLIALPAIAAHSTTHHSLINVLIALMSFSLGASCNYLINDIIDLPHDRAHLEKRHRPIASGLLPTSHAVVLIGLLAAFSVALASMLPTRFIAVLIAYFTLSIAYSLYLKKKLMIDVVLLAALYGIRVVAGGAATGITLSDWLVAFCFFIFFSLALMKRAAELVRLPPNSTEEIAGRSYRGEDRQTITALMAASGFVAVLVLALYITSPAVATLYRNPHLLWGICIVLIYWLGRAFILTDRGEMRLDPVLFAATDRVSLLVGGLVIAIFVVAI